MLQLQPLHSHSVNRFLALKHDQAARGAAARAAGAIKVWAALLDASDLARHAAGLPAGVDWLATIEVEFADLTRDLRQGRKGDQDLLKADALLRHQHDSAAMELAGRLSERASVAHSRILDADRAAAAMRKTLDRQGFTPEKVQEAAARAALGLEAWQAQEARDAITSTAVRIADLDRTIATLLGNGISETAAAVAELRALRDRLEDESRVHANRVAQLADEAARLSAVASELGGKVSEDGLSILATSIAKAQRAAEVATADRDAALADRAALESFLSDPTRAVDALPDQLRAQLLELSHGMRHRPVVQYPARLPLR